jgi:hypothetical protein
MMIGILKKQSRAVFVAYHAIFRCICHLSILRRIRRPSCYFMAYLLSVMLLHAQQICIIAARGKTTTPRAASQIPIVRRLARRKTNTAHRCDTVYEFCWRVAAASGKSADPILHRKTPLLKTVVMRRAIFLKIKEGLSYLSLDLIYHLKG